MGSGRYKNRLTLDLVGLISYSKSHTDSDSLLACTLVWNHKEHRLLLGFRFVSFFGFLLSCVLGCGGIRWIKVE